MKMTKEYESIVTLIESKYEDYTELEKTIADYFINNDVEEISSQKVRDKLFVSEAALTRFAQKLGFSGYREFTYFYKEDAERKFKRKKNLEVPVFDTYQEILSKTFYLYDDEKFERVAENILKKKRVYLYGMGSSGLLCKDFSQRIIRLGIDCEAINDSHELLLNQARLDEEAMVLGISYSGKTVEVMSSLKQAKKKGCYTVLMVSVDKEAWRETFDEVLLMALKENLDDSKIISPQFPGMILLDILYMKLLNKKSKSDQIFTQTINEMLAIIRKDENYEN